MILKERKKKRNKMTVKLNNELGKCNQIKKKKRETRDVVSVWNDSDTTVKK